MKHTFFLFCSILKKDIIILWRYKTNTIVRIIFLSFVCYGLIFGVKTFTKTEMNISNKEIIIGGYFLWILMISNYGAITSTLTRESLLGTFEQIYLNNSNIIKYLLLKCVSVFVVNLLFVYFVIFVISILANLPIQAKLIAGLPIIILGIPALWGMSLGVGSLVLVFKQIDTITTVISIIVITSMPYIVQKSYLYSIILPFGLANKISQNIFTSKIYLKDVAFSEIIYILLNDIFYLLLGIIIFKISLYFAKEKGRLSHH